MRATHRHRPPCPCPSLTLKIFSMIFLLFFLITVTFTSETCSPKTCALEKYEFPNHEAVRQALIQIVSDSISGSSPNGGFNFNMWATIVDRDGVVRVVAFTGHERGDQWPGSRVISAQKANTANSFSLPNFALSTANLWAATQPGGTLFGLQHSNPVDTKTAYGGINELIGTARDPMTWRKIGGVNVFGGGLALYNSQGKLVGGLGVSGDSSCTDHIIAWKLRHALNLDYVPAGPNPTRGDDNIVYDVQNGMSMSGWGHPFCGDPNVLSPIANGLSAVKKLMR